MWPFRRRPVTAPPPRTEPVLTLRRAVGIRLSESGLAMLPRPQAPPAATPWTIPKAPPGVAPAGAEMAMDRDMGDLYAYAGQGSLAEGLAFFGYPYLSELAQRPEYRVASETIAKHMTRRWIRLHASGDKAKDDKLKQLRDAMDRHALQDVFCRALEHDGFFGSGQVLIDTGKSDDPAEMATELTLTPAKVGKGGLKGFRAIEPIWTYPGGYSSTDPTRPDFYRPQAWHVQGRPVHASRWLRMVSREVPDILKPGYLFGGLSLSQLGKPYVDNWITVRQEVTDLIGSFNTQVLKTNMAAQAQADGDMGAVATIGMVGMGALVNRAQMFTQFARNRGVFMLDKETEDFGNVVTPLGTLDHLQAQAQEHPAAVWGIPLVILLGITPSGLNASSDGEIRVFNDRMHSNQEGVMRRPLRRALDLIQLSEFGEIDSDIGFDFEPLWEPSEAERATIRKTNADAAAVYIESSVLDPAEERGRLAHEDQGMYNGLDLSKEIEPPDTEAEPGAADPAHAALRDALAGA